MSKKVLKARLEDAISDAESGASDAGLLVTVAKLRRQLDKNKELRDRLPKKDRTVWDELRAHLDEAEKVLGDRPGTLGVRLGNLLDDAGLKLVVTPKQESPGRCRICGHPMWQNQAGTYCIRGHGAAPPAQPKETS